LPFSRARVRGDVDAELSFHLQGRIEELIAAGMSRTTGAYGCAPNASSSNCGRMTPA